MTRILGIDLGTTNSRARGRRRRRAARARSPIAQVVGPGEIAERADAAVVPAAAERARGAAGAARSCRGRGRCATRSARSRASAARSCRTGWCRRRSRGCATRRSIARAQVLPFRGAQRELDEAMEGGERVSPVNASARYLAHLRAAWDDANPDEPADEQEVLVTVPASFDPVARELTVVAAREAGLRQGHAARGAAGRVLRVPRGARRGVAQGPARPATSCWCATSAAAPPTSR